MISVIIPTYNRANTILRSVNSVLNQTFHDLELIVVDDCSTDNTISLLSSINDKRLKVVSLEKNSGACVARNRGIDLAQGQFIAFQDSDDEWKENKLEVQLNAMLENDADVVFCKMKRYLEDTQIKQFSEIEFPQLPKGFVDKKVLLESSKVSTQMMLCKRELFRNIRFNPQMPRMQDYDIVIKLCMNYKFYFIDEVLVDLYLQSDSITMQEEKIINAMNKIINNHIDIWLKYPDILAKHYNGLAQYQVRNKIKAYKTYIKAYKYSHNLKYLVKAFLDKLDILSLYYKKK